MGISEPPGFWSSIDGDRDDPQGAGGLLEHDPLVVLVGDDALEDLAVGGEHDQGVILLLDRLVGDAGSS